jgi:tetratricopeptide (TPR) repeat protein
MLMYQDRIAEAIRMRDSVRGALHLDSALSYPESTVLAEDYIRAYRFGDADRLLNYVARKGSPGERGRALWDLTISLRAQGRPRAALGAVAGMEAAWLAFAPDDSMPSVDANLARAQSLLEAGQPEQAARLFRWLAAYTPREPYMQARAARHRAWTLTLAATAYAVARDTAQLSWLADSVQALGRQSAYGRDRRLHDHIRGLLALARGQAESAAAAFSRAIFSPTAGYTRTNYDLGRTLLGLHRPDAAIAVLRPALHGSLEASNFYVTRTELEQLLAEAFAAAGQRDSAAAHRRIVDRAWAHAEPDYLERRRLTAR